MQATNEKCQLNRTSRLDHWMMTEDSPVYVGRRKLGTLSQISADWNARLILANALYFNAVNVFDDKEADDVITAAFKNGGDAAQKAIAPAYAWVHQQIKNDKVSPQIAQRIMAYMFAINWTVAKPHASFEPRDEETPPQSECLIRIAQFDDGDYTVALGDEGISCDTVATINYELGRLITPGFADVDFMYFSNKPLVMDYARIIQKYIKQKWGYDFLIQDNS